MRVHSKFGRGSTFSFTCQFAKADTDLNIIKPLLQPYKRHTVLYVDRGHSGCVNEVTKALQDLELVPLVIGENDRRPLRTIEAITGQSWDCLIVDCSESARSLRELDKFKYVPMVMLTPSINVNLKSALEDGILSYMTTPCLPIDLANSLIPALEGRATPSVADQSRSFDILLAEDNIVNQKLAVKILEKYHHTVTVANNGLEAFAAISEKRFDVVLMDVQMPLCGGFEATAKIREWEKKSSLPRTPIIALTAHAMVGDREMCLQNGMDEYLSKPLKQSHLLQTIMKCATMGGEMLDQKNKTRRSLILKDAAPSVILSNKGPPVANPMAPVQRPGLENRGFTEAAHGAESPSLLSAYQTDPLETVSTFPVCIIGGGMC